MKFSFRIFRILLSFCILNASAQIYKPISWKTSVKETERETIKLTTTATIMQGWFLYSQNVKTTEGSFPMKFNYPDNVKCIGITKERPGIEISNPLYKTSIERFENKAEFEQEIAMDQLGDFVNVSVEFMACTEKMCLPPKTVELSYDLTKISNPKNLNEIKSNNRFEVDEKVKIWNLENGYLSLFFLSFLAGLIGMLTPCIFPMIPITVMFFTKQNTNKMKGIKNAIVFGLSIVAIYVSLGTFVVGIFGSDALNRLSTSVAFNLLFFVILLMFSFSFLGGYELRLPSAWSTKIDKKIDKKNLMSIFFMALALAIVSFSCTGPIVGTALVTSATQGGIGPVISMLGFSLGIALPFTSIAIFPGWLNALPKSGNWLHTIKMTLGFIELALALKFLSNADLVLQAHLLERELFIAIWIVIFFMLGLYLIKKLHLSDDSISSKGVSIPRLIFAILTFSFVFYMIPGLFGAPTKLISIFAPPLGYSESVHHPSLLSNDREKRKDTSEDAHILAPFNILEFKDYQKGLDHAQKTDKPILLNFTGYACVNCRKMEQNIWTNEEVLHILQNDIVLISLHVDDRRPFKKKTISPFTKKKYDYVGQKWSEFQERNYKTNAQPFHVILNKKGENVSSSIGYEPDVMSYLSWLKNGIEKSKK